MIYSKDPDETADYEFEWAADIGTDTISNVTIVADTGITVDSNSNTDNVVTVWLSGGTARSTYRVVCRITTVGGRTLDQSMCMRCRSK